MPTSAIRPPPAAPIGRFGFWNYWLWAAVVVCAGIAGGIAWLHHQERATLARAKEILEQVHEARIDLSKGFLHLLLSGEPHSPFQRDQGWARLNQALEALERSNLTTPAASTSASTSESASASEPGSASPVSRTEFDRAVRRFRLLLEAWETRSAQTSGQISAELRTSFHTIESLAERVDLAHEQRFQALTRRLDQRFAWLMLGATLLLTALCFGVYLAGRRERQTDRALQERSSELLLAGQSFAKTAATVPGTIYAFRLRPDGSMTMPYASAAIEGIFGFRPDQVRADARVILALIHPDDAPRVHESIAASARTLKPWREEFRARNTRRGDIWVEGHSVPEREPDGSILWHGFLQDITERRLLEAQFRQVQKMEGIGQLAGGVAHDFNNILAVIMMQAELTATSDRLDPETREGLHQIGLAANRAAHLTRQLLLFSRRQILQPRDLDLNEVVTGLASMLRRIIGEDVVLRLQLHPRPLLIRADAGMLDQVLLNLAVNARDAMPEGGHLELDTDEATLDETDCRSRPDATPGRYAVLRVRDSGTGIAADVLPRIFEPFFTTKEPGRGTGLGLATVFGIVKQHRGLIEVSSQVGQGSSFQVLLPSIDALEPASPDTALPTAPRGGTETLLLAEDDASLRLLTRSTLERRGYHVLEAANGKDALEIWRRQPDAIALLLTDLVMPGGMTGFQLASLLRQEKPGLKVIYTSGYSAELAGHEIEPRAGQNFLQKPCPPDELLEAIRRCLDA